jgi:hypothetical protein
MDILEVIVIAIMNLFIDDSEPDDLEKENE